MPDSVTVQPTTGRPAICLNMIVRNEAHIIREALDSVAPHIASWVIVDTGSDDGTQDMIGSHMADLGIPECRFWLHLGEGWQFFAPEPLIGRLTAVLAAEPEVVQVGINVGDAVTLTGVCAAEDAVRRTADGGRYVVTDVIARGPAMFDTGRVDRATAEGLKIATLDEVLCIAVPTE
jgi:hypothetical protein